MRPSPPTRSSLYAALAGRETAVTVVGISSGHSPAQVVTASYDTPQGISVVSNRAGTSGALSPFDGSSPSRSDTVVTATVLVKVGECSSCSSDLFADSETAATIADQDHSGSCVLCGSNVAYRGTGEIASIQVRQELADHDDAINVFDFDSLNLINPNNSEEIDMSANQARKALRASVANALKGIVIASEEVVELTPPEADFAADSEDSDAPSAMDMDEGNGDVDETTSEEASADAPVTTAEAPNAEPAAAVMEAAEPVTITATEEPAATVEAPAPTVVETADAITDSSADDEITDDPAYLDDYEAIDDSELSSDADMVPVGDNAYYLVQDNAPVAVLAKEAASANVQAMWLKPVQMRAAFVAGLASDRAATMEAFGGSILRVKTSMNKAAAQILARAEVAAKNELATAQANLSTRYRTCTEIASLGIIKGVFGAKFENPLVAELAAVLKVNGVRQPLAIINAAMAAAMPKLQELVIEKANELLAESDEVLAAKSELVGTAGFQEVVPTTATDAPAAPPAPTPEPAAPPAPVETASVTAKVNIAALVGGLR